MPEAPAISNHSTAGPPPGYWNAPPGLLVPPHYPPPPPGIPPPHVLAQIPPPGTRQRDLITVQTLPDMDRSSGENLVSFSITVFSGVLPAPEYSPHRVDLSNNCI